MKTYYDLTRSEKKEYFKQFNKTPIGKDMKINSIIIEFFLLLFLILGMLFSIYANESLEQYELVDNLLTGLFWIFVIVSSFYRSYRNINFSAWLKNKHSIKRW